MIAPHLTEALGWTLLHSLWQAALVAVVFYLIRPLVRRPTVAYWLSVVALLLIAGWSIRTFVTLYEPTTLSTAATDWPSAPTLAVESSPLENELLLPKASANTPWREQATVWVESSVHLITFGWLLGMVILSTRLLGGLWYLHRLKRYDTHPFPAGEAVLRTLGNRLRGLPSVPLLASGIARVPMVIGHLKPAILLPVALISHLPPEQLEAIIAHELAHVHRRDYWVNLLQSVVEILFFYHPAVGWLSSVVREEREKCCDDLAVAWCGNKLAYARALAEAEAWQQAPTSFALAFAPRAGLFARIERLIRPRSSSAHPGVKLLAAGLLVLTVTYLTVGDTLARQGERWLGKNMYVPSLTSNPSASAAVVDTIIAPAAADTLPPAASEDGWRASDKAQTYRVPSPPDTIRDESEEFGEDEEADHFSFYYRGNGDSPLVIPPPRPPGISLTLPNHAQVYLNFDDEAGANGIHYSYVFADDTLPPFSDSVWRESIGEISATMGTLSEELADYLTDSVVTETLQERLGAVQRELGQLQAELGSSLQRAFNEERMEEIRDRLHEEEERIEREMERMHRNLERSRERADEQRQRAEERRAEAVRRREEVRARAHERIHNDFDDTVQQLEEALLADGLIESGKQYRFELKPKGLYINRKKQDDALRTKYHNLLEISENTHFSITRTAE